LTGLGLFRPSARFMLVLICTRVKSSPFGAPDDPKIRADKPSLRCLDAAGGVVILEPCWKRPAGPKHTRAERVGS